MSTLRWTDWEDDPLRKAKEDDRIVLLTLAASWCRFSNELLATTFQDPTVIAELEKNFIPVLVDPDRRPDLDSRYNMGGWPSIAFVSPEGNIITGDNFLTAAELLSMLQRVRSYYDKHRDEIAKGVMSKWTPKIDERTGDDVGLCRQLVDDVVHSILDKFDHRYGGWGETQKFAHPESIDFAMIQYAKTGDTRMKDIVMLTLSNMMEGGIHDLVDGGFFRFSTTRDWRVPNFEKVLDNNAARLCCFLEAYQIFAVEGYRKAAQGIVRWMRTSMLDTETGAFFGSQGDHPDYYAADKEGRKHITPPRVDRTIYTNWNAIAITSLLRASVILQNDECRELGMNALRFLLKKLYSEKHGMYHYWDGTYHLPGMLSDQAYMIRALVTASQFTGDADLLIPAENLAERLLETHRAPGGGFFDLEHSSRATGALRRRNRSILENAVLAEALTRLSYLSKREEFRDVAKETLEAFVSDYKEYGHFVAGYARAVDLFLYEPIVVTIVGDRQSGLAKALRHAAQCKYVPSRIVQALDPELDPILISRSGYEASSNAKAYMSLGKKTLGVFEDPDELALRMEELEASRRD